MYVLCLVSAPFLFCFEVDVYTFHPGILILPLMTSSFFLYKQLSITFYDFEAVVQCNLAKEIGKYVVYK